MRLDRAVRFVWQAGRLWTLSSLGLLVIQGLLPLLALYLMKLIVDAVILALGASDKVAALQHVMLLIGLLAGFALSSVTFAFVHFNFSGFFIYVGIGLVLAQVYRATSSIVAPITGQAPAQ